MFKIVVKLADGSVERWEQVTAKMVSSIRNMYNGADVFKFSVMEQTAE
jgi:hypothetical protein